MGLNSARGAGSQKVRPATAAARPTRLAPAPALAWIPSLLSAGIGNVDRYAARAAELTANVSNRRRTPRREHRTAQVLFLTGQSPDQTSAPKQRPLAPPAAAAPSRTS